MKNPSSPHSRCLSSHEPLPISNCFPHIIFTPFLTLCLVCPPPPQLFLWWGSHRSYFFMIKTKRHGKLINIAEMKDAVLAVPALCWVQTTYNETCQLGYLEEKGFIFQQEGIQPFFNAATSQSLMTLPASNPRCLQKGQEESGFMLKRLTAWNPLVEAGLVHCAIWGSRALSTWLHLNLHPMVASLVAPWVWSLTIEKSPGVGARKQQDWKKQAIILCYGPILYTGKLRTQSEMWVISCLRLHSTDHTQDLERSDVLSSGKFLCCSHCRLLLNPSELWLHWTVNFCISQNEHLQSRNPVVFHPLHL